MIKRCAAIFGAFSILFGTVSFYNASAATEGSTKFSIDTGSAVLQLSVPSNPAVINLNPTVTGGTFGSTTIGIEVATNNMTGYTLTMTPTNNQDNTSLIRTELVGSEQSYRTLPTLSQTDPVSTGYPESSFTANRWGYKITGDNYYGINPNNTTVSHPAWVTNAPTNKTTHNLTLAAKVNAETTSGAYETTLNFSAMTNAVPLVTLEMSYGFHGKQKVTVGNEEYYKMQDMSTEICSYTNEIPSELEVVDIRDNTIYHIAKMLDGRCWMLDNLALDAVASKAILSPANTNATQAAIDNFVTSSGTAPQTGWATTAVQYETNTSVYTQPRINTASKDLTRNDLTNPDDTLIDANAWKFGVYYNYCAASIGTYCHASDSGVNKPGTAIDAEYDICPAGWRLPTGFSKTIGPDSSRPDGGEYQTLYDAYPAINGGDDQYTRFRKAFRLPLSGFFINGSASSQGTLSSIWSSTYFSADIMYRLRADASSIYAQYANGRLYVLAVRCIVK